MAFGVLSRFTNNMSQQDFQVSEYIAKLEEFIPEFSDHWSSDDAAHNFGAESTFHGVFSEFSYLVMQRLEAGTLKSRQQLFSYIESVIVSGGEPANAACTCFLENILNRTPGAIAPNSFVPYLGIQSKEFCRGWDEFTGVKTEGI